MTVTIPIHVLVSGFICLQIGSLSPKTEAQAEQVSYQGRPTRYWRQELEKQFYLGCAPRDFTWVAKPDPAAIPVMRELLKDSDPYIHHQTIFFIGLLGTDAVPLVPELVNALRVPSEATRVSALEALQRIGPAAKDARAAIKESLHDDHLYNRHKAAMALWRVTGDPKFSVATLIDLMTDRNYQHNQRYVAQSLGEIGPLAIDAVPVLAECFRDRAREAPTEFHAIEETDFVHTDILEALQCIAVGNKLAASIAESALDHPRPMVRSAAAVALAKLTGNSERSVQVLLRTLGSNFRDLGMSRVVTAFGDIGPAANEAVPTLIRILNDSESPLRRDAAESLGKIGPLAVSAIPALRDVIRQTADAKLSGEHSLNKDCKEAIRRIQSKPKLELLRP